MQNKGDVAGLTLTDKIKELYGGNKHRLRVAGAGLAGYVMAGCFLFGGVSPFAVALCAALGGGDSFAAAVGAVAAYLVAWDMPGNIKYIAAVLLVCCFKWLFWSGKVREKGSLAESVAAALFPLGIAGGTMLAVTDATLYDAILFGAELFLACGAAYFFARSMAVMPLGWEGASRADMSCMVIALSVVLMGLTGVQIGSLSLGRVAAVLGILLCARAAGEAGGAVSGIAAGIAVGLSGGSYAYVIGAYAVGGLAAGMLGNMGRIATAAAFIVVNTATALLTMSYSAVYTAIFEIFLASVLFIAIPPSISARLRLGGAVRQGADSDISVQASLRDRLSDISLALQDISDTTKKVSEKLGAMESDPATAVPERVAERVCSQCGMKTACWQFRYNSTMNAFNDCILLLKQNGTIRRDQLPSHFVQTCCKVDEFLAELRAQFGSYVAKQGTQHKVSKVREVVTDQFHGMALMLDEIAGEICSSQLLEPHKTGRVREYFEKQGFTPTRVFCTLDEFDRIVVELSIPNFQIPRLGRTKTTLDLCGLLEAEFEMPQATQRDKVTTLVFTEKATFTVELGAYQLASGGNRLCGDAYEYIRNKSGQAHFFLSDGMGSGGSAAVDSAMACGLLRRLIAVGVGYEAALKMVNSALLIKSGDESLATIDACSLDLFTGKAQFYKAGAAPTFFVKDGKMGYIGTTSLPAGILHGISFETSAVTLHEGDVVVMVSDGVIVTGQEWLRSELADCRGLDMQRLCEKIALTAKSRRTDGHEDDITVMAAALRRGV